MSWLGLPRKKYAFTRQEAQLIVDLLNEKIQTDSRQRLPLVHYSR